MLFLSTEKLSCKVRITKVVLIQLKKIKAAAKVMMWCKLNLGALLALVYLNRFRVSLKQRHVWQPTKAKPNFENTLRVTETGLI